MKRCLLFLLVVLLVPVFAHAGPKALTELTGGASYSKPDGGNSSWAAGGELAIPIGSGYVLAGPAIQLVNAEEDFQAIGGVLEINLMKASGLFVGGRVLYDPDAPEGADDHSADLRGGFKAVFNKGGLLKIFLEKTVDGYGESEDLVGAAMFGVRF